MKKYRIVTFLAIFNALCAAQARGGECIDTAGASLTPAPIICTTANLSQNAGVATMMEKAIKPSDDIIRHNHFRYQIDEPDNPSGEIVVLLHGSGGDENTLFPFARPIWPNAILIGIRGRLIQEGTTRWYRKITPTRFDQTDVGQESDAFVDFLTKLAKERNYDLSGTTFVGYSNGANLLTVVMMEHPRLVRRAILMRSMPVLDKMPDGDLRRNRVLTISGKNDTLYSPYAPTLSSLLLSRGAKVESHMVAGNHMIGKDDADIIRRWLEERAPDGIAAIAGKSPRD